MSDIKVRVMTDAERGKYVQDFAGMGYTLASEERVGEAIELAFQRTDERVQAEVLRPLGAPAVSGPSSGKIKIMLATPCYGGQLTTQYLAGYASLLLSLQKSGIDFVPCIFGGESLITRARNRAVAEFLRSDCTHLVFVDADIGFTGEDVAKLFKCNEEVVCGAYPLKHYDWAGVAEGVRKGEPSEALAQYGTCYAANLFPQDHDGRKLDVIKRNGHHYVQIQDAATGFLLIARAALERIIHRFRADMEYETDYAPHGEIHFNVFHACVDPTSPREVAKALFIEEVTGATNDHELHSAIKRFEESRGAPPGRYLSEDFTFSRYHQMCGGRVWLCLDVNLSHTGVATYQGNVSKGVIRVSQPAKKAAE